tara:strand:- start:5 stop:547 length:543 start_codon:yes stop_codon:yes gene_type:complete
MFLSLARWRGKYVVLIERQEMRLKPSLICLALSLLLFSATSAWSADWKKGWDAYDKGDYATAAKRYSLAAEQGYDYAQYFLGLMYYEGKGVSRDYSAAFKWHSLAAEQGFALAQHKLGVMYVLGRGVIQDIVYAHMWWNIAASQGDEGAAEYRNKVAKKMTPSHIAEAQKLARECVRKKL